MKLLDFKPTSQAGNVLTAQGKKGQYFLNVMAWSHLDILVVSESGPTLVRLDHYCTQEDGIEAASRFDEAGEDE